MSGRSRLRQVMRGYRALKKAGDLPRIMNAKIALTNLVLDIPVSKTSKLIFGVGTPHAEIATRQFLLLRLASFNLNKKLLATLGKPGDSLVHPLPPQWRDSLQRSGFSVAKFRCALAWQGYLILAIGYGAAQIARGFAAGVKSLFQGKRNRPGRFVYFHGITRSELPQPGADGRSHDLVTWYLHWPGHAPNLQSACHSVAGAPTCNVGEVAVMAIDRDPPFSSFAQWLRFLAWSAAAVLIAAVDVLRGRWWNALMLYDGARACRIRLQDSGVLAREYLFPNSTASHRPLWTYEAERKGSRVTFYFYSTNCDQFKAREGYRPTQYLWQAMNWSRYLVWDQEQANFVRRAVGDAASVEVVGPIWFSASAVEMPRLLPNTIAVFDIQPRRKSFMVTLGIETEYYIPEICNRFLLDVHEAARQRGWLVAWKRKRSMARNPRIAVSRSYEAAGERLALSQHLISIDPATSAFRVIEASSMVISLPFTSTALIARSLGKPSYYYDPSRIVQKDDRSARGIPVISGVEELRELLKMKIAAPTSADAAL